MVPMASGVPSVCYWEVILPGVMFWRAMLMGLNRKLDEVKNDNRKLEDAATSGVFMLTASMDVNSLFHDAMPAANEAATNILTILMASKLIGQAHSHPSTKSSWPCFKGKPLDSWTVAVFERRWSIPMQLGPSAIRLQE